MNFMHLTPEIFFWICAISGSSLFLIRCLMLVLGFTELHTAFEGDAAHPTELSFKVLSLHSITGFIMMFGWAGLSALLQYQYSSQMAVLIALFFGSVTLFVLRFIFSLAKKLISPGAVFKISDAVGKTGTAYQRLSSTTSGKIHVSVQEITRELEAFSETESAIAPFSKILITKVVNKNKVIARQI